MANDDCPNLPSSQKLVIFLTGRLFKKKHNVFYPFLKESLACKNIVLPYIKNFMYSSNDYILLPTVYNIVEYISIL